MKYLIWMSAVVFLVFLAVALVEKPSSSSRHTSRMIGKSLPDFSLPILNTTQQLTKAELLNDAQPYRLINIFASWCTSCAMEHPLLARLAKEKNLSIYGIAWHDEVPALQRYLNEKGNPYHQVLLDDTGTVVVSLGITGAPESLLVDNAGKILWHGQGMLTEQGLAELHAILIE